MLSFSESSFLLMEVASFRYLPFFLSGNLFYYLIFAFLLPDYPARCKVMVNLCINKGKFEKIMILTIKWR